MIDLSRGIIRIGGKQELFGYIHDLTLLAMFFSVCFFNTGSTVNTILHYLAFAAFMFTTVIDITRQIVYEKRYTIPISVIWYGMFTILAISSYTWAADPQSVTFRFKMLIEVFGVILGVTTYISSKERLYKFFNIVCLVVIILSCVLLARTPIDMWSQGFNNNDIIEGLNINTASQMMTICVMITFYLAYIEHKRIYYVPTIFFTIMAFFSGSRKAFLMLGLAYVMIIVLNFGNKKYFRNLCIILVLIVIVFIAAFEIPVLYDVIGYRMEDMIEHFIFDVESDASLWQREMYIKKGWEYFMDSPLIGNGINNFGFLFKETGLRGGYAHNNFIELLSGLGIVGFILYYWFHAYLIINLGIMVFRKKKIAILGFTYMLIFTIFEYGIVSYYDRFIGATIAMSFAIFSMIKTEDEKRYALRGGYNASKII